MNSVGYAFEEALVSLRRSGRSALVSVGTIAIAFVALGGFLLVSVNLQQAIDRWLEAAELSVYLQEEVSDETRVALEQFLKAQPVVLAVEFVSKARAIERFRADFPELNDVTTSLADNPFPASLEVRLRTDPTSGADADVLARDLGGRDGVADVRYDRQWLARLQSLVTAGRVAGALVAGVLMLGAAFTVAAVVRLSHACPARRTRHHAAGRARRSVSFGDLRSSKACCLAAPGPPSPCWRSGPCTRRSAGGWGATLPASSAPASCGSSARGTWPFSSEAGWGLARRPAPWWRGR